MNETLERQGGNIPVFHKTSAKIDWRGGIVVKRVFAILAAVAAGLGMVAAIIAAVANRHESL